MLWWVLISGQCKLAVRTAKWAYAKSIIRKQLLVTAEGGVKTLVMLAESMRKEKIADVASENCEHWASVA